MDRMNVECRRMDDQIQEYLDTGGQQMPPELAAHLDGCAYCRDSLKHYSALDCALSRMHEMAAPAEIRKKVMAMIQTPSREASGNLADALRLFLRDRGLAFAAALLMILTGGLLINEISLPFLQETAHSALLESARDLLEELGAHLSAYVAMLLGWGNDFAAGLSEGFLQIINSPGNAGSFSHGAAEFWALLVLCALILINFACMRRSNKEGRSLWTA
jgi:hypothetical protein